MAYNFMCETAKEPNWKKLNKLLIKYDKLETFPIFELESNKFGLAISIPMKNIGESAYKQFVSAQKLLSKKFNFRVFDMYYGKEVDKKHRKIIKSEIT